MRKISLIIGLMFFLILFYVFLYPKSHSESFIALGNIPFTIRVENRSYIDYKEDIKSSKNLISELEGIFSVYLKGSELSKLNMALPDVPTNVSVDLYDVLKLSRKWFLISEGLFDPTVAPLVNLWKKASKEKTLPSEESIKDKLKIVGFDKIGLVDGEVVFKRSGMKIDLGAIAKGYIADRLADNLRVRDVDAGFVDAGGDIRIFGDKPFVVGIKNPISEEIIKKVSCMNGGIVTSGNYARFSVIDGRNFSHIVNPKTGWPLENASLMSVTALAPDAVSADALATSLMVMGEGSAKGLIDEVGKGYGVVLITGTSEQDLKVEVIMDLDNCSIE